MAEAREGISGEAATEPAVVDGGLQRERECHDRCEGQCLLPGEREGGSGADAGRESGGCEAEDECVVEGRAGVKFDIVETDWANGACVFLKNTSNEKLENINDVEILIEFIKEINNPYDLVTAYEHFALGIDKCEPGWIYIIGSDKLWKCGHTKNFPLKRLKDMQTAHPSGLKLLAAWYVRNCRISEKYAHEILQKYHYRGEWFQCEQDVILNALLEFKQAA